MHAPRLACLRICAVSCREDDNPEPAQGARPRVCGLSEVSRTSRSPMAPERFSLSRRTQFKDSARFLPAYSSVVTLLNPPWVLWGITARRGRYKGITVIAAKTRGDRPKAGNFYGGFWGVLAFVHVCVSGLASAWPGLIVRALYTTPIACLPRNLISSKCAGEVILLNVREIFNSFCVNCCAFDFLGD